MITAARPEMELAPGQTPPAAEKKWPPGAAILFTAAVSLGLWAAIVWLIHWLFC